MTAFQRVIASNCQENVIQNVFLLVFKILEIQLQIMRQTISGSEFLSHSLDYFLGEDIAVMSLDRSRLERELEEKDP